MSKVFRSVHAANAALKTYQETRNLDVIRNIDLNYIDRYDVWQCVFEKEIEAYHILQEKELYKSLIDIRGLVSNCVAVLCVIHLERAFEWKSNLSFERTLGIILDVLGDDFIHKLLNAAKESLKIRMGIVKPYHNKDNDWVGYSKSVVYELKKYIDYSNKNK